MTAIAQQPRPRQRTRHDRARLEHADHHPPGGAPLPADAAADRDGDRADGAVLPHLPLHVRRRDPRRRRSPTSTSSCPASSPPACSSPASARPSPSPRTSSTASSTGSARCPIPRSSVLAARAIADTAILALASAVTVAIAFAVGFRLHGSVARRARGVRARDRLRLRLRVAVHHHGPARRHRPGRAGHGDDRLPARVRLQRLRDRSRRCPAGCRRSPSTSRSPTWSTPSAALTLGSRAQVELGHPASYYVARSLVWAAAILAVSVPLAVAKYQRG